MKRVVTERESELLISFSESQLGGAAVNWWSMEDEETISVHIYTDQQDVDGITFTVSRNVRTGALSLELPEINITPAEPSGQQATVLQLVPEGR